MTGRDWEDRYRSSEVADSHVHLEGGPEKAPWRTGKQVSRIGDKEVSWEPRKARYRSCLEREVSGFGGSCRLMVLR